MTADDYLIRLAEAEDIAVLPSVERRAASLYNSCLSVSGLTPAILERVSSTEEFDAARRRGYLWVAVSAESEPVGFALVTILDGQPHLNELDVIPEHGRKGIGTRLLWTVCGWARDAGYASVTLSTFRDIPWNAPFYERHGFRVVDPAHLLPEHRELVTAERARGLRTDLRVVMECRTSASLK